MNLILVERGEVDDRGEVSFRMRAPAISCAC